MFKHVQTPRSASMGVCINVQLPNLAIVCHLQLLKSAILWQGVYVQTPKLASILGYVNIQMPVSQPS